MTIQNIEDILDSLVEQQYVARSVIYSNSSHGRIETVVRNVYGDDGKNYYGEPSIQFEARRFKNKVLTDAVTSYNTLVEALNHIGIYSKY
jgi:hypothetical protein